MRHHIIYGGRNQGRTYWQSYQISVYLAFNKKKVAAYMTLDNDNLLKYFQKWFPHLIINKIKDGLRITQPACEL